MTTITAGSIYLLQSQVMADVPEGGGAITSVQIPDGGSNTIFPDISDLDRAIGSVKMRQIAAAVRTLGSPIYMGANLIVAEPPADPRVSVTLFAARPFERRTAAVGRVESYLAPGPEWPGYLLENHLQGQRTVQLFQRVGSDAPLIGQTLVLTQNEGQPTQKQQYVRVIAVASVVREFSFSTTSGPQDYTARVVTCEISDALRFDFAGSPPSREFARASNATRTRETIVADAGVYAGASPLAEPAELGDFSVRAQSLFTQLVPSAQTPVPMADLRANGLSGALVPSGDTVTLNTTAALHPAQPLHLGASVYPGTLTITRSGVTLTDSGERLMQADAQVGTIDHEAGIASLSTDVWGTGAGAFVVTFKPAAVPDLVQDQFLIRVTPESQSLAYAFVLPNQPLAGTLSISYLAQGRWYTLRDDGSGALRGNDATHGVGTLSPSGGVALTLGALPDVGSAVMVQFSQDTAAAVRPGNTELLAGARLYAPINTSGAVSEDAGTKTIEPGALTITWTHDGAAKTATDNGAGALTGDAAGSVDYAAGVVRWSPNELPASGTVVQVVSTTFARSSAPSVTLPSGTLGAANVRPGSVRALLTGTMHYTVGGSPWGPNPGNSSRSHSFSVYDRDGSLYLRDQGAEVVCGSINYTTGDINITSPLTMPVEDAAAPVQVIPLPGLGGVVGYEMQPWAAAPGARARSLAFPAVGSFNFTALSTGDSSTITATVEAFRARTLALPNKRLRGVSFAVGSARYVQLTDDTLVRDPSPSTGGGTPAGSVQGALSTVNVLSWPVGASPAVAGWRGVLTAPAEGVGSPFAGFSTVFRIPAVPLQSGSVSVQLSMQDGTVVNATAGTDGKINHARLKGLVDHQSGLIQLFGVNPTGAEELEVDLSALGIAGLTTIPADLIMLPTVRYSAVSFTYLPLDAGLIGLDPVRLPSDGRVPIFRKGGLAVVGHTGTLTATVSNGQTLNTARVRLSRVRVFGGDGGLITTGYTPDLEAGTVTFTDVAGYAQPVTVEHRVEDMAVVREVNINGELSLVRPLTHDYPSGSVVSSAITGPEIGSNLFARVSHVFDQQTWTGVWADEPIGSPALASFNHAEYPITTSNAGAVTERWLLRFTSSTAFELIGENVGLVAVGNTAENFAPLNPATGVPYMSVPALGWGSGWVAGNALRVNTIDAMLRAWAVMTVQPGPITVADDAWQLLARGSVDTP